MLFRNSVMTLSSPLKLDAATTALVLIDLQQGILPYAQAPYDSAAVLANAVPLAAAFRAAKSPVVLGEGGFARRWGRRAEGARRPPESARRAARQLAGRQPRAARAARRHPH